MMNILAIPEIQVKYWECNLLQICLVITGCLVPTLYFLNIVK